MIDQVTAYLTSDLGFVILIIYSILVFTTLLFFVWGLFTRSKLLGELKSRNKSWWIMATLIVAVVLLDYKFTYIAVGLLSFVALRELFSHYNIRDSDRGAMLAAYLAVPFQFFFAYKGWYGFFSVFIPVFMFILIPFILVLRGDVKDIGISMASIPTALMLTAYSLSHLAFLVSLPGLSNASAGGKGLFLFIIFLTEMNDVFQFMWGKILGKHKIIPKISPNKTWEGFIGGFISTIVLGFFLKFLTPFDTIQVIAISAVIAGTGFIGDVVISAFKRDKQIKDMGSSIPGHGGILDRVDSLALSAPVFFHIVYFLFYVNV
jgi:phosphatidate cytidylyltransferase